MSSSEDPCPACKWTSDQQRRCAYESSVRLFHGASNRGYWSLGSKFFFSRNAGNIPPAMRSSTPTSSKRIPPSPTQQAYRSGPRATSIFRSSSGCLGYR
ncbi:hypothetical protein PEX1_057640 [Penicillium expansum]|uniref:Uncharacterized protein n=1 Tax=Penicillium expansum TaxID=27334 RepID=A0A0A2L0W4_PENEN|nr:hypothetical protein PEX2_066210 [Penicillium expansum]KGO44382.1 hypothetical protein PEXP_000730 [Penicillium expansum]KGO58637.1 hypothetical protein PEX2_066210 [Penicillium expansum]KGO72801.1 hypothetical protein PEX1_057640 [Penicillium expansum]